MFPRFTRSIIQRDRDGTNYSEIDQLSFINTQRSQKRGICRFAEKKEKWWSWWKIESRKNFLYFRTLECIRHEIIRKAYLFDLPLRAEWSNYIDSLWTLFSQTLFGRLGGNYLSSLQILSATSCGIFLLAMQSVWWSLGLPPLWSSFMLWSSQWYSFLRFSYIPAL